MEGLAGRNALITGGATGIGKAVAMRLGREGANVAINYLDDPEQAERAEAEAREACRAVREAGCRDLIVRADVSDEARVAEMFEAVLEAWGRLDILVNNAGIMASAPSHEMEPEAFDRVVAVNLRGAYLCAREAIRHFLSRDGGGVIVNNSSVHQVIPKPGYVGYSAAKGGMANLTRTLALEYAHRRIRVNGVGPGAIATPMNEGWLADPERRAEVESHIPAGRVGDPEEIAAVVAFLASDEAAYVTGQTLYADGGLTLYPDFRTDWSSRK